MADASLEQMVRRTLTIPADPETFKFAVGLFQEAAAAKLHGSHIPPPRGPGLHLTNMPINRGMMAIVRETQHLDDDQRQSLMMRVMHFGETLEQAGGDARFSDHLQANSYGFRVSEELMAAIATVPYVIVGDQIKADLEGLAAAIAGKAAT